MTGTIGSYLEHNRLLKILNLFVTQTVILYPVYFCQKV